jgi:acetyltransferase-like isoleucine patch superfamily enzyme
MFLIRNNVVIEDKVEYGKNLDTGYFVILRTGCLIGDDVCIWSHCTIDPYAIIGNNVRIHNHVYICQYAVVGDDVFIGPGTKLLNDRYPPRYNPDDWEPPIIKEGAIIGGGVIIGPGVTIGEKAIIGAGSVVINNVPANQIWVGTPARRIR